LIIIPGGIWLAIRMIPPEVLAGARETASSRGVEGSVGRAGAAIIISLWVILFLVAVYFVLHLLKRI
jgi:hypothetical protein